MRAARYRSLGPAADVLEIVDLPTPEPGPDEVLVQVAFSGINPTDWKRRKAGPDTPGPEGLIPHLDGSGVITAVGSNVSPQRIGERVWFTQIARPGSHGTAAQFIAIPDDRALQLPDDVSLEFGACLGIPFITAHRALTCDAPIAGTTVLVTGGGGAVGNAAIQLGVMLGATVIATASTPEKIEAAKAAGAHHVFDYRQDDLASKIRSVAPDGIDRIVEVAIGQNLPVSLQVLKQEGLIVSYAAEAKDPVIATRPMMTLNLLVRYLLLYFLTPEQMAAAFADIQRALNDGRIRQHLPVRVMKLEEIAAAQDLVEAGTYGRILIDLNA